jgi:hypothetical protein
MPTYVHVLHLTPNFTKSEVSDSRRAFLFDLMKNRDEEFALLTCKPWPQVSDYIFVYQLSKYNLISLAVCLSCVHKFWRD